MDVMSEGTCIHIQINMTDDNLFRIRLNLFAWYVNHTGGKKTFFCMLAGFLLHLFSHSRED